MVVRHHHVAIVVGQLAQGGANVSFALGQRGGVVVGLRGSHSRQHAQIFQIQTLDQASALPPLRAHEHQSLIGCDTKEPGAEARIAPEGTDPPDDLEQSRLHQIEPVVIGYGVASELALHMRANQARQGVEGVPVSFFDLLEDG